FRRWALLAAAQAEDAMRVSELRVWQEILTGAEPALGRLDPARDTTATTRPISLRVPPDLTGALLTSVPAACHAGSDDGLPAALAAAVAEWCERPGPVLVDVEGHGREPLDAGVDLSRTVGWFTSVHPVRLDPGQADFAQVRAGGEAAGQVIK